LKQFITSRCSSNNPGRKSTYFKKTQSEFEYLRLRKQIRSLSKKRNDKKEKTVFWKKYYDELNIG
jgi:hypothetical protein